MLVSSHSMSRDISPIRLRNSWDGTLSRSAVRRAASSFSWQRQSSRVRRNDERLLVLKLMPIMPASSHGPTRILIGETQATIAAAPGLFSDARGSAGEIGSAGGYDPDSCTVRVRLL